MTINFKQLYSEIKRLVDKCPNNIYEPNNRNDNGPKQCFYMSGKCSDGSVECLIGQACFNLGLDLEKYDKSSGSTEFSQVAELEFETLKMSTNEIMIINDIQRRQDIGLSWKECI